MSEFLKAHKEGTLYFCTLTVVGWADVFTRARNAQVIIQNLAFCQANKGLELFAYGLMPSHLHLIARVQKGQLSDVLRDFKSFTAKRLLELIANEPGESRKEWLTRLFKEAAQESKQNQDLMFWAPAPKPATATERRSQSIRSRSPMRRCSSRRSSTSTTTRLLRDWSPCLSITRGAVRMRKAR